MIFISIGNINGQIIPLDFWSDKSFRNLFADTHLKSRSIRSSSPDGAAIEILSVWALYFTVLIPASLFYWQYMCCYLRVINVKVIHQWFRDRQTIITVFVREFYLALRFLELNNLTLLEYHCTAAFMWCKNRKVQYTDRYQTKSVRLVHFAWSPYVFHF